jgi:hypothetical protein
MNNEDVQSKHEVEDREIGVVASSARMDASDDSRVLVSLMLDDIAVVAQSSGLIDDSMSDEFKMFASLSLFKKLFKDHFHPDQLISSNDGVKVWVMLEVPRGFLRDEVIMTCDEKEGLYFIRSKEEGSLLSQYIPIVKDEEGNEITS